MSRTTCLSFLCFSELSCSFLSLDLLPALVLSQLWTQCSFHVTSSGTSSSSSLQWLSNLVKFHCYCFFISGLHLFVLTPYLLLIMHFCKMSSEFIPMRWGRATRLPAVCLSVCVWTEQWTSRDQMPTVVEVTRWFGDHDRHRLFAWGFLDQNASGEICALCTSALIYCDNWSGNPAVWGLLVLGDQTVVPEI